jgi:leukotriene A-4 hydrolase/aminopeptidase
MKTHTFKKSSIWIGFALFMLSCNMKGNEDGFAEKGNSYSTKTLSPEDQYSYARPNEAVIKHLDLDIEVNFRNKKITGKATFQIENKTGTDKIFFDTKHLDIEKVTLGKGDQPTDFALVGYEEYLGRKLEVSIEPYTRTINIFYSTRPEAMALQWLNPEQTAGKVHPYLFTQSEPTYARSWIPIQDSPGIRITYNAKVKVPKDLVAVMSATNPQERNDEGVYSFKMEHPIPGYLIAMAVGDLVFKPLGERTGVYTERELIDAAVYEFGELEEMLAIVEGLYGAYRWGRYDLIVLPPSFPFGGMENPMLTFVTPTLIAGDRSLVSVVAHELAHSWSGNLVTNATWNDFWINEGFTVYLERRIMEVLYGKSYTEMLALLGYQDLQYTINLLGNHDPDTYLELQLNGRDPDEALTDIAYEKGALFLKTAENEVGRKRWDKFLRTYFDRFAFQSMSSKQFVKYFNQHLIQGDTVLGEKIKIDKWVYGPGIPDNHPPIKSERFIAVDGEISKWVAGAKATDLIVEKWTTHEWLHFLRHLPNRILKTRMSDLDNTFMLTQSGNSEILCAWFIHVIRNEHHPSYIALEDFLVRVGRRKFLSPLYKELSKTAENKKRGLAIYKRARPNYHLISAITIDGILGWEDTRYLSHD